MSWWQRVNLLHTQTACLCRYLRMLASLCVASALAQPALAGHSGDINTDTHTDLADLLWGIQALTGMRTLSATQAEDYLRAYARHFGLYDKISFNSEVVRAERTDGRWQVQINSSSMRRSSRL